MLELGFDKVIFKFNVRVLMKKCLLFLLCALALIACGEDELLEMENVGVNIQPQTKSSPSIADFNIWDELSDIPVNIMNMGSTANRYLSCQVTGKVADLYSHDDGSGRQQWLLKSGRIIISRGHAGISELDLGALTPNNLLAVNTPPTGVVLEIFHMDEAMVNFLLMPNWFVDCEDGENVRISHLYAPVRPLEGELYYLSASSLNSTSLSLLKSDNLSSLSLWNIVPVGEYELVDLQYVRTTVDDFDVKMAICDNDDYTNNTSVEQVWDYSLSVPIVETSSFSNTEGVAVNMSRSTSVGLPNVVGEGSSINYNTTIQQQSSRSHTYGESTQATITRTRTAHITVPPRTSVRMETTLVTYEGTLTYVATMKKVGTNKTFRVKGKWTGNCFSKFSAKVFETSTGKLLKSLTLE